MKKILSFLTFMSVLNLLFLAPSVRASDERSKKVLLNGIFEYVQQTSEIVIWSDQSSDVFGKAHLPKKISKDKVIGIVLGKVSIATTIRIINYKSISSVSIDTLNGKKVFAYAEFRLPDPANSQPQLCRKLVLVLE